MKQNTIKVENKDLKSGYMVINEYDFDEKVHKKYKEPDKQKQAAKAKEPDKQNN